MEEFAYYAEYSLMVPQVIYNSITAMVFLAMFTS